MNDIRLRTDGFVYIRVPVQSDYITQLESECDRLRERMKAAAGLAGERRVCDHTRYV